MKYETNERETVKSEIADACLLMGQLIAQHEARMNHGEWSLFFRVRGDAEAAAKGNWQSVSDLREHLANVKEHVARLRAVYSR